MNRFLLLLLLLATLACSKDPTADPDAGPGNHKAVVLGNPGTAVKGTLAVQLVPEAAEAVEQATPLTRSGATRSGIATIDQALTRVDAVKFERIIPFDEQYEALYTKTGLNRWYCVYFDKGVDLASIGEQLALAPEVAVVEYTHEPYLIKPQPTSVTERLSEPATRATYPMNDPLLKEQWHFDCKSGPTFPSQKDGADINLFDAWKLCKGDPSVIVAVLDEPVQYTHPDLEANMWTNPENPEEHGYNFYNQSPELDWISHGPNRGEYADHGSHVAGVIAAVNNNGIGISGIAGGENGGDGVKIMSCQMMGYSRNNIDPSYADVKAFDYAMKNGAVIAQCSWGYQQGFTEAQWNNQGGKLRAAIETFIEGAGSNNPNFPDAPLAGGLVIFAAGNDGPMVGDTKAWPAAYESVIAVGSMGWDFKPAEYTDYGTWVDITAPGGDYSLSNSYSNGGVFSTVLCDDAINYNDNRKNKEHYGYQYMQGTSMACPHVSGVAALGLSYAAKMGKKFTAQQYCDLLLSSVYGIDQYFIGTKEAGKYDGNGNFLGTVTLHMEDYVGKMGGGCVDALKLLLAVKGTPALYVGTGSPVEIDLAKYFGGSNSKVELKSTDISTEDLAAVGLSAAPAIEGTKVTVNCLKVGSAMMTVKAKAGDTTISKEFAIVSRNGLAANGGWM